jgi:hypothetical protein
MSIFGYIMLRSIKLAKAKIPIANAILLSLFLSALKFILPYFAERTSVNTSKTAAVMASNIVMSCHSS